MENSKYKEAFFISLAIAIFGTVVLVSFFSQFELAFELRRSIVFGAGVVFGFLPTQIILACTKSDRKDYSP